MSDANYPDDLQYIEEHDWARVEGDTAIRTPVQFGLVSTRHIEVLSGLKPGDRIIVSDSAAWESHERVYIK